MGSPEQSLRYLQAKISKLKPVDAQNANEPMCLSTIFFYHPDTNENSFSGLNALRSPLRFLTHRAACNEATGVK